MNASSRCRIVLPLVMLMSAFAFSAQAQSSNPGNPPPGGSPPGKQGPPKGQPQVQKQVGHPPGPPGGPGYRGADARFAHGEIRHRDFGGHAYRGRLAWDAGRWHHEVHNGRDGWWWDVGGVWYFYPQRMDGPPTYVSEDFADDVVYADAPPPGAYPPPGPGYPAAASARSSRKRRRWRCGRRITRWAADRPRLGCCRRSRHRRRDRRHRGCHGCFAAGLLARQRRVLLPLSVRTIRASRSEVVLLKRDGIRFDSLS